MNRIHLKYGAYAVLAAAVAGGAGYWWSARLHAPPMVEIASTTCGVPPATARFDLPLETAVQAIGDRSFVIGPIEMPQGGGIVHLRFDRTVDGKGREVKMLGDTVSLPVVFGRGDAVPERITLTCRDGTLSTVRYQAGRRGGTTFTVVAEEAAAMAPTGEPASEDGTGSSLN